MPESWLWITTPLELVLDGLPSDELDDGALLPKD